MKKLLKMFETITIYNEDEFEVSIGIPNVELNKPYIYVDNNTYNIKGETCMNDEDITTISYKKELCDTDNEILSVRTDGDTVTLKFKTSDSLKESLKNKTKQING